MDQAIWLACDLLAGGVDRPELRDVAGLRPGATWRDSCTSILAMLSAFGFSVPLMEDDEQGLVGHPSCFRVLESSAQRLLRAVFHWLPRWEQQDALERFLNLMLDELDHESVPQAREAVVTRMRVAVRAALG